MNSRKITDPFDVKFEPFNNYGSEIPGMSWKKITIVKKLEVLIYLKWILAKSIPHKHLNFEEFIC